MNTAHPLDIEETLHLALHASSQGNPHACMGYLKEILQRQPEHASARYLLAVQHAGIGLIDRAIDGLRAALALDVQLEAARLQLGLLLLERRRPREARQELASLSHSADAVLRACGESMTALVDQDIALARAKLTSALALPTSNPSLLSLARQLLDHLSKEPLTTRRSAESEPAAMFLGAYRQVDA